MLHPQVQCSTRDKAAALLRSVSSFPTCATSLFSSIQRIYVHESVYDAFVAKYANMVKVRLFFLLLFITKLDFLLGLQTR